MRRKDYAQAEEARSRLLLASVPQGRSSADEVLQKAHLVRAASL